MLLLDVLWYSALKCSAACRPLSVLRYYIWFLVVAIEQDS
jgi:hypothetical protein